MGDKFLDKILDDLIHEAVQKSVEEENSQEQPEDIFFSKEHEQKMEELFKEIRYKEKMTQIFSVTKRVAVIVIATTAIMAVLTPSISAWKEKIKEFFIKEEDEYSWIKYGDPSDANGFNVVNYASLDDEVSVTSGDLEVAFLGYVPDGFSVDIDNDNMFSKSIRLKKENQIITLKISKDSSAAIDTEEQKFMITEIEDKTVYYLEKNDVIISSWECNGCIFKLRGNTGYEELVKIIENINYEEIKNIF